MKTKKHTVLCGADIVAKNNIDFYGKCGLITNPTGVLRDLTPTIDMLKSRCNLTALFGPEHGVRGDIQAGENVDSHTDKRTGLPVFSLYGDSSAVSEEALTALDTVIFDIQDVGARFYTYAYTMTDSMKLCAEHGIRFVVFDRPNPLGGIKAEGTVLDRKFSSFVGRFPTPTRPGLTIGEFAKMMNDTEKIGCDLTVIPMEGWSRDLTFDDTDLVFIQPSPNIPTTDTAFAYIGTCIFEGTNLSEGRGTTKPFEMIGAPWLNTDAVLKAVGQHEGIILRECCFTPTFSDYEGELCCGIQLHVTNRDTFSPFATGIRLLDTIRKTHSKFEMTPFMAELLGTDEIFSAEFDAEAFIAHEAKKVKEWQDQSKQWYLY
ncbi:MAG: DUF1343 domain-containing protein [Clostridia bacterium]|nr:DUF1343 domain-containing protein [Clostridia bacterium]